MTKKINHDKIDYEHTLFIAQKLQELRISQGLTRKDFVKILDITQQQLQKYESGKNRISPGYIKILCDYFGLSSEYFFNTENNNNNPIIDKHRKLFKIFQSLNKPQQNVVSNLITEVNKIKEKENGK